MSLPDITSRSQWLEARTALLAQEKAMTRARDALNTKRRMLPMVRVDVDYRFDSPAGTLGLLDLFDGRRQLAVQHFMFDPDWDEGCPSCTAAADEISAGLLEHLHSRETSFVVVSRAPLVKIERYKAARGWSFPWVSSYGGTFNYDFHVTIDSAVAPVMWNYRTIAELRDVGMGWLGDGSSEQPGYSFFLRQGDEVFHTYSVYARGTEMLGDAYSFLDCTALGRQEDWEEPKGRADVTRGAEPNFAS
jgi:predicted dithiol-disulfide oxidoreductase (DUF899 family)